MFEPKDLLRYLDSVSVKTYNESAPTDILFCINSNPINNFIFYKASCSDLINSYDAINNIVTGDFVFVFDNFSTCDKVHRYLNRWKHSLSSMTSRYLTEIINLTT
jgi:hypothetical protein